MSKPRNIPANVRRLLNGWAADTDGITIIGGTLPRSARTHAAADRRLPTPLWALNDEMLRELIVVYMEERARLYGPQKGTLLERLARARQAVINQRPRLLERMDKLCKEYVEKKRTGLDPHITDEEYNQRQKFPALPGFEAEPRFHDLKVRLRGLEIEIERIDTYLRYTANGGADILAAMVYLYYRMGIDSVGVGAALGLKPPHIRIMLYLMAEKWNKKLAKKYPLQAAGTVGGASKDKRKNHKAGKASLVLNCATMLFETETP